MRLPSDERIAEYVEGARKVLADDLPAGHKLWKSWALDLADNVLALAALLTDADEGEAGRRLLDGRETSSDEEEAGE